MRLFKICTVVSLLLTLLAVPMVINAQVTSDFASSNQSWTTFDYNSGVTAAATWNATGGNPGGNLSYTTLSGITSFYWTAPAQYNGNFGFSYNQTLTFDLNVSAVPATPDNSNADIILTGNGINIYYQLPTKPAANTWTSYSVQLNESAGWRAGCFNTCAAPSQTQMKAVLENISKLQIRIKYYAGNTFSYTGLIDNVVLNSTALLTPPSITSFSPTSAVPGTSITIAGNNFNPAAAQNRVLFNGIQANVTGASATQLTVTLPKGSGYGPISVSDAATGLQGFSAASFSPLFDNNQDFGGRIIPATMARGYYSVVQTGTESNNQNGSAGKGDFDGDGWIDLATTETSAQKIFVYRNLATGGAVSAASFASAISLNISTIPGGSPNLGPLTVADVDSDGMPDITAVTSSGGITGYLAVFRNTSSPGAISFAAPEFFSYPYYSSQLMMTSGDFDADGRIDFAYTTGTSPGGIWMNQNLSTPGNLDFSYGFSVGTSLGHGDVKSADLNGDGKPELIATIGTNLEVYQNVSSPGAISFNAPFNIPVTSGSYLGVGDLDNDNKPDLFWSTYSASSIYFSKNNYSGTLNAAAFGAPFAVANKLSLGQPIHFGLADLNSDGHPDLVIAGNFDLGVMQNLGGSLSAASISPTVVCQGNAAGTQLYSYGLMIADLDGDNKPEAAFAYTGGGATAERGIYIFHNESFPAPSISSVVPGTAFAGSTVTLSGTGMYTGNINPKVRLSEVVAPLSAVPTNTTTQVTVPPGGRTSRFVMTNHGLTALSPVFKQSFNTGRVITATSFGPNVDFTMTSPKDVLATADFDDDGKIDIIVSDGTGVGVYQNSTAAGQNVSTSSFTKLASVFTPGYNVTIADMDGDGKTDLHTGFYILQNTTSGSTISFGANVNAAFNGTGTVVADFNHDGKIDLAGVNGSINVNVYENLSSRGTFAYIGSGATYSLAPAALPHPSSSSFGGQANSGIVAADFDNDGYDDIAGLSNAGGNFVVFRNLASNGPITLASFSAGATVATSSLPYGITANDFDGDGKPDLAVVHYSSTNVSVYRNTSSVGSISFAAPLNLAGFTFGYCIASQDLDGDGKPEIVTGRNPNPGVPNYSIYQNTSTPGTLNFSAAITTTLTRYPHAIAIADINQDEKPDVLIVAANGPTPPTETLMLFQNNITTPVISFSSQPSNTSGCDGTTQQFTISATGTTNISYQWQYSTDGIVPYVDITNTGGYTNATTATLSVNTSGNFGNGYYRCETGGDFAAIVFSNPATLTIHLLPSAPTAPGVVGCPNSPATITATGGSNGQYRWYTVAVGGTADGSQMDATFATPALSTTTTYFVSINNGQCEGPRTSVTVTVQANGCSAPVITPQTITTQIGNTVTLDLVPLISTPNSSLDLTSLSIVTPPSSGAAASISAAGVLTISYAGLAFSGIDNISIRACDTNGNCSTQQFVVEVSGEIIVFNGVSPGGKNPTLVIQNIDALPETKVNSVQIFDRWENLVWHGSNYNNTSVVFSGVSDSGGDLPTGVYYYKVDFESGRKTMTGFISLRRQ